MTNPPSPPLLPCPFCGARNEKLVQTYTNAADICWWTVECLNCSAEVGSNDSEADAATKWNARPPLLPEEVERVALRDKIKAAIVAAFDHQSATDPDFWTSEEFRYDPSDDLVEGEVPEPDDVPSHTYGCEGYVDLDGVADRVLAAMHPEREVLIEALEYVKEHLLPDPCPLSRKHVRRVVDAALSKEQKHEQG